MSLKGFNLYIIVADDYVSYLVLLNLLEGRVSTSIKKINYREAKAANFACPTFAKGIPRNSL